MSIVVFTICVVILIGDVAAYVYVSVAQNRTLPWWCKLPLGGWVALARRVVKQCKEEV